MASVVASVGVLAVGWQVGSQPATLTAVPTGGGMTGTTQTGGTTTAGSTRAPATRSTTAAAPTSGTTQAVPQRPGGRGGEGGGATSVTLSVPAGASGTFTGQAVTHRWGSVQVTVTLASGKITRLNETLDDGGDGKSARINQQSVPVLRQEILAASGGGAVSTVSGATYTTAAYLSSLQSALDQAK